VAVTFLCRSGIRLVIYLDDLLIVGSSLEECSASVCLVIKVLQSLGFLINFGKSETLPTQCMEYIGLIINSVSMSFHLTERKIDDIKRLSRETLKKKKFSLRELAKIIGNVNWASYAVNFAQAHFRNLQSLYNSFPKDDLDLIVSLTQEARSDLSWWLTEADFPSGKAILTSRPDLRLASDASRTGWGVVCLDIRTGGPWTRSELLLHINGLELLAALKSLECFTASVRDWSVEIQIDNKAAVS
jgi:hypothetical protein